MLTGPCSRDMPRIGHGLCRAVRMVPDSVGSTMYVATCGGSSERKVMLVPRWTFETETFDSIARSHDRPTRGSNRIGQQLWSRSTTFVLRK